MSYALCGSVSARLEFMSDELIIYFTAVGSIVDLVLVVSVIVSVP